MSAPKPAADAIGHAIADAIATDAIADPTDPIAPPPFDHDVCIIGTGRVGLPLGLSLLEAGLTACGHDINPTLRDTINAGRMPFAEPGYDALIATRRFTVHATPAIIPRCRALIITVGTPLHPHIESDLTQIDTVLAAIAPHLRPGHLICLRSTVAPGTTRYTARRLTRLTGLTIGRDLHLAFCPERIAEGRAHHELRTLPQIIGTQDPQSAAAAEALFTHLAPEILHTDAISAELVKLFNNINRYVHFAVANQFALIADTHGAHIHEIRRLANHNYPRNAIAAPGLTAGTCLRKDFGLINEWSPHPDLLLAAWKMNEYMPAFLVSHLQQRQPIEDRTVAVLGYAFKRDTDDTRDSLVPKLIRYLERALPAEIRVSDPHLGPDIDGRHNWSTEMAIRGADAIFIAIDHTPYATLIRHAPQWSPDAWIVDLWNVGGIERTFYRAAELMP